MNTTNNTLIHFGIKGQKWGVLNGPPYPLRKEAEYIYKNRHKLTDEEFSKALQRLQQEIELGKKLNKNEAYAFDKKRGQTWIQKFLKKFSDVSAEQMGLQLGVKIGKIVEG